ncbi:hypothetical protein M0805_005208 [Coniferiporia weirii]|nr:hypothetical protein M0805_005208 [Coniferiporia weirii]
MLPRELRRVASYFILGFFVALVLLLAVLEQADDTLFEDEQEPGSSLEDEVLNPSTKKPDFTQYVYLRTLSKEEVDFEHPNRRIIIVGDIHGMKDPFYKLLDRVQYTPSSDLLIHTGDIIAKSSIRNSLDVLSYMTEHNVTGVRGNHDQMVIEWRAWIERARAKPGGAAWLEKLERMKPKERKAYAQAGKEEWQVVPDGWALMDEHHRIARAMSPEQYAYLRALPLVLHAPRLHTFVVHAGLLPIDPHFSATSSRQPLAHIPGASTDPTDDRRAMRNVTRLRTAQEHALLVDVPQNMDAWVLLNMRSIRKDNTISREKDGSAWAPLWNRIVARCNGFDTDSMRDGDVGTERWKKSRALLPCHPSTVIYGHAASRGLDIKRWTKGLDSGCVYGRRLSALVLTPSGPNKGTYLDDGSDSGSRATGKMQFGDAVEVRTADARIVSVPCSAP